MQFFWVKISNFAKNKILGKVTLIFVLLLGIALGIFGYYFPSDWERGFAVVFSFVLLNAIVYWISNAHFLGKDNAALLFMILNFVKDIVWAAGVLYFVEEDKPLKYLALFTFFVASIPLYIVITSKINK
ncbi:MAG: hypothetical protein KBA33_08520 [Cloacibacterium sp.]|nr:hypothetical protein [Cloacibacterium sp.]